MEIYPLSQPIRLNLQRLCAARTAVIVSYALAVFIAIYWLEIIFPTHLLVVVLSLMATVNIFTYYRLQNVPQVYENELFIHILIDVGLLTALLYFSGGSTNPFITFYLVPLVFTAVSLPQRYTWMIALLTSVCYGVLLFYHQPLAMQTHNHNDMFALHVAGMWFGFVFSACLITWFGVRMAQAIRNRDIDIANRRAQELKQERVVALGALAAGAAHELGTPLATLSLLSDELVAGQILSPESKKIFRDQISRCKDILNSLSASANSNRALGGGKMELDDFLKETISDWQQARPMAVLANETYQGTQPTPLILSEITLSQSICNLLHNAADASEHHIGIHCEWTHNHLIIEIADRGPGLAPEVEHMAGNKFITTKQHGLGLGLYLSFSTLERLGGTVKLYNREGGGTVCQVNLPLDSLLINA